MQWAVGRWSMPFLLSDFPRGVKLDIGGRSAFSECRAKASCGGLADLRCYVSFGSSPAVSQNFGKGSIPYTTGIPGPGADRPVSDPTAVVRFRTLRLNS